MKPGDLRRVLRRLALRGVVPGGDRDHRARHRLAEEALGRAAQLAQDQRRDFLGRDRAAGGELDPRVAVRRLGQLVRQHARELADLGMIEAAAEQALGAEDREVGAVVEALARGLADDRALRARTTRATAASSSPRRSSGCAARHRDRSPRRPSSSCRGRCRRARLTRNSLCTIGRVSALPCLLRCSSSRARLDALLVVRERGLELRRREHDLAVLQRGERGRDVVQRAQRLAARIDARARRRAPRARRSDRRRRASRARAARTPRRPAPASCGAAARRGVGVGGRSNGAAASRGAGAPSPLWMSSNPTSQPGGVGERRARERARPSATSAARSRS